MTDALRFELVRLRTIRSTYWLIALALLLNGLVAFAVAMATRNEPVAPESVGIGLTGAAALVPLPLAPVLMGLMGVLAVGHEYRHGLIRPTLTALPRRSALVAARLLVLAATAGLVTLASIALNWVVLATVWAEAPGLTGEPLPAALTGYVLLTALWAVLGAAATLVVRSTVGVMVLLLVVPLIVEPLLQALTMIPALADLQPATRFLPFTAGAEIAQVLDLEQEMQAAAEAGGVALADVLSRTENGLVFAGFVALVLAAGWTLFERRDA